MERVPFNEDSGRFAILIDMERPEEAPSYFDAIEHVGKEIDDQLARPNEPR